MTITTPELWTAVFGYESPINICTEADLLPYPSLETIVRPAVIEACRQGLEGDVSDITDTLCIYIERVVQSYEAHIVSDLLIEVQS